jgi:putative transposase
MGLSQSVVPELLEAFRAGEGVDLIRESVRLVMQELIETEATQQIGAGRYERAETRVTDRNGSRARLVATQAGDVRLRIPKLRKGSFFPAILEPRRRIDQALYAVVMEAYVNGVSTRAVDDLVAALGIEFGISKSEVSDLRRPGRACRSVPFPAAAPHRVRLCVPRRHLPPRPPHRAGHLDGGCGGHRSDRHRRP